MVHSQKMRTTNSPQRQLILEQIKSRLPELYPTLDIEYKIIYSCNTPASFLTTFNIISPVLLLYVSPQEHCLRKSTKQIASVFMRFRWSAQPFGELVSAHGVLLAQGVRENRCSMVFLMTSVSLASALDALLP